MDGVKERIQKILGNAGVASRRNVEEMIRQGRVAVNGKIVTELPILIDPRISFGRPVVGKAFVSTRSILERIDAGETVDDVARDYELTAEAIEEAVVFERAA